MALRGHENGNALFQDLDVYMPGSDTPFLWFVGIDLNGCLIYEYDDDQRILAWFDGDRDDVLKWSDGSIYRRGYDIDPDPELKTGGWASEDNAIDFENIAREPIPGAGNATTLPRDRGDDSTGAKEFDKENPMKTNGGSDTNISSDIQWEFLIKYYNDQGFGNSTAETTATCLGHYDKDQDVDSGATYCFYLHGYFDLAKEWESKLQGYNDVVKEWESKLQGYNEVSYQLHRPWKRPRFG